MLTFKRLYEQTILDAETYVEIPILGKLKAKLDSGNEAYNVLHGIDLHGDGEYIIFQTVHDKRVRKRAHKTIDIHIGSGNIERRPVILLDIILNGRRYESIPFSIADRSQNAEPVLIGAPFIKDIGALIKV